jgi:hypothetical protein
VGTKVGTAVVADVGEGVGCPEGDSGVCVGSAVGRLVGVVEDIGLEVPDDGESVGGREGLPGVVVSPGVDRRVGVDVCNESLGANVCNESLGANVGKGVGPGGGKDVG